MSAPTTAESQDQTSQPLHEATQTPTQVVPPEPRAEIPTETQAESPIETQAPLQAEGAIAIDHAFDDSNSAYSDEL